MQLFDTVGSIYLKSYDPIPSIMLRVLRAIFFRSLESPYELKTVNKRELMHSQRGPTQIYCSNPSGIK